MSGQIGKSGKAAKFVRAAGGVVHRVDADGAMSVILVHRPRYDDWSLPKGKAEPGETDEQTAAREVEEETGLVCVLGDELPGVEYVDHQGRPKQVRYWAMTVVGGAIRPSVGETDEVCWLRGPDAAGRLSYERDRGVLAAFLQGAPVGDPS